MPNWWNHTECVDYVNLLIPHGSIINFLKSQRKKFNKAISVGFGDAHKELSIINSNLVDKFDFVEIDSSLVDKLKNKKKTNSKFRNFIGEVFVGDYNQINKTAEYDLVYWDHSLHHMADVFDAVRWSKEILKEDGLFFVNDYVGPTRWNFTGDQLDIIKFVLKNLPGDWPERSKEELNSWFIADPSEMIDSDNIIPAIKHYFPNIQLYPLGGLVYEAMIGNNWKRIYEDKKLVNLLLFIDRLLNETNRFVYCCGCSAKSF